MPTRSALPSNAGRRILWIALAALALLVSVVLWGSAHHAKVRPAEVGRAGATAVPISDDPLQPLLPDPSRTPGATLAVTPADICVPGYSRKVRNVPSEVKRAVYRSYGIAHPRPHQYEVDHLISLELGGSNSVRNLWPESYETMPWNARVKDVLENELHRRICAGKLDLATAQHEIATDWIAAYHKYVRTDRP